MNETTTTHEQLSALLDGELPRDELRFLLRRLERDSELAQRWSRYQLISQTLKRERAVELASERFAATVMQRIDAAQADEGAAAAGVPLGRRMLRWAGGGAIAASVAVFALLATRPAGEGNGAAGTAAQAAAPAVAVAESRPLAPPPQQLLPDGFANYAQPASYESIVPNYVPRTSGSQMIGGLSDGFVPYVLVVGSRQVLEPQPGASQNSAPRQ